MSCADWGTDCRGNHDDHGCAYGGAEAPAHAQSLAADLGSHWPDYSPATYNCAQGDGRRRRRFDPERHITDGVAILSEVSGEHQGDDAHGFLPVI